MRRRGPNDLHGSSAVPVPTTGIQAGNEVLVKNSPTYDEESRVGRKVLLYEINEVPWKVLDLYVAKQPASALARVLAGGECRTTVNRDPDQELQPWRTWPTFHTGLYTAEHKSRELGQDPNTFEGVPIWETVERTGGTIGLFGPLQSWPARKPRSGGFYVPDTFSQDSATFPVTLERFQAFNLAMTQEQGYSSVSPLSTASLLKAGIDTATKGLTFRSAKEILRHLINEKRDSRHKASRAILQALPTFDLFWRLYRKECPDLGIYFTNHVAGMMHRYWGDSDPDYAAAFEYSADEVFGSFVMAAMDVFSMHLSRVLEYLDVHPDVVLVIASSMGQGPIASVPLASQLILKSTTQFLSTLGLEGGAPGLAMYPRYSFRFADESAAIRAASVIETLVRAGSPVFTDIRVDGDSVSCKIDFADVDGDLAVSFRSAGRADWDSRQLSELGLGIDRRIGGSNTAYHVPDGVYITYGSGINPDGSREPFEVTDARSRILALMGISG